MLGGKAFVKMTRVKLIIQSSSLLMSYGVSHGTHISSVDLTISPHADRRRVVGRWRYICRSDW